MTKLQIGNPFTFKLFASTIKVVWDNKNMNDKEIFGECDYACLTITLSTTDGLRKLSDDRIMDCFYHEKVHMILYSMKELGLTNNEQFVESLAKLLRQSEETIEF